MRGNLEAVCVERRRHEREPLERPCKLLHAPSLRFLSARTRDLSPGGALIELGRERELAVGDRVEVLVDWAERGLVRREAMIGATVVRLAERDETGQRVGVAFDRELVASAAA